MVVEDEFERTFLAKHIPSGIGNCNYVELEDNYIPKESDHPVLRIRKKGDKTVITKKYKKKEGDASVMIEETIPLAPEEYSFINQLDGKKFLKKRYSYEYEEGKFCEIDIYQDKLKGLVVIDFEFNSIEEKDNFKVPDFCLIEVTNEEFLAGGMLCGKSYEDLKENLENFNYKKID
jgi:CYTH domain-containing protein